VKSREACVLTLCLLNMHMTRMLNIDPSQLMDILLLVLRHTSLFLLCLKLTHMLPTAVMRPMWLCGSKVSTIKVARLLLDSKIVT